MKNFSQLRPTFHGSRFQSIQDQDKQMGRDLILDSFTLFILRGRVCYEIDCIVIECAFLLLGQKVNYFSVNFLDSAAMGTVRAASALLLLFNVVEGTCFKGKP